MKRILVVVAGCVLAVLVLGLGPPGREPEVLRAVACPVGPGCLAAIPTELRSLPSREQYVSWRTSDLVRACRRPFEESLQAHLRDEIPDPAVVLGALEPPGPPEERLRRLIAERDWTAEPPPPPRPLGEADAAAVDGVEAMFARDVLVDDARLPATARDAAEDAADEWDRLAFGVYERYWAVAQADQQRAHAAWERRIAWGSRSRVLLGAALGTAVGLAVGVRWFRRG